MVIGFPVFHSLCYQTLTIAAADIMWNCRFAYRIELKAELWSKLFVFAGFAAPVSLQLTQQISGSRFPNVNGLASIDTKCTKYSWILKDFHYW